MNEMDKNEEMEINVKYLFEFLINNNLFKNILLVGNKYLPALLGILHWNPLVPLIFATVLLKVRAASWQFGSAKYSLRPLRSWTLRE